MKHLLITLIFLNSLMICSPLFSQEQKEAIQYQPMPLPQYAPPKDSNFKENKLMQFDMAEKKFITFDKQNMTLLNELSSNPSQHKVANEFIQKGPQSFAFSLLQPADLLTGFPNYPFSTIVKLNLTFYNPTSGATTYSSCSGAMINSSFIITAGHCVYSPNDQSYCTACTVIPAYNMGSKPFGETVGTNWYTFTQWTNNGSYDYDMAIMSLASPMGNTTGWLGWGGNNNNSFFTSPSNTFNSIGYPATDCYGNTAFEAGERMYYMNGYMDYFESTNSMCHYNMGYHGQSGSGLYYKDASSNRYVYGVLSHGGCNPTPVTCHCRMDGNMFAYFNSIIPTSTTGLNEQNLTQLINISPNPSNGIFHVDFTDINFTKTIILVKNIYGQEILKCAVDKKNPIANLDLTSFQSGIYFIQTEINNQVINGKVVKN